MNRNEFLKRSTGIIGELCIAGVFGGSASAAQTESGKGIALDDSYLLKGVDALARAHRMSAMAGHLGAAVVAGYFIAKQHPDLDPEVYEGIESDLKRVMGGESVFGAKMTKNTKLADSDSLTPFRRRNRTNA